MKKYIMVALIVFVLLAAWSACFTVHETEYAIVSQFGNPHRVLTAPGFYLKWPWPIDAVYELDSRLLVYDLPGADEPPREFLTLDKKNIEVSAYACWRIQDPLRFLETVRDRAGAEARLGDIVTSELGKVLGIYNLSALISTTPEALKLVQVMDEIEAVCVKRAEEEYGVQVADFRIKRIDFPEQNRRSVFDRMRAERKRIATRYRSEGEEMATKIRAEADKRKVEILSEAERTAEETRGRADAEATRIYAEAYGRDPEFYEFLRSLQSYETSLREGTTIVLSAGADYLKWLHATGASPPAPTDDSMRARPATVSPPAQTGESP